MNGAMRYFAAALLISAAGPLFAQDYTSFAAKLTQEEKLLASGAVTRPADIARIEALSKELDASGFKDLASRCGLDLTLARERAQSAASADAVARSIKDEAAAIKREQGRRTNAAITSISFWTGVGSLGTALLASTVSSWAYGQFETQTDPTQANTYFLTGQIANLATVATGILGVAGLGLASIMVVGLYGAPLPPEPVKVAPSETMTREQQLAEVDRSLKEYSNRLKSSRTIRTYGTGSLIFGALALLETGVLLVEADQAGTQYTQAANVAAAQSLQASLQGYQIAAAAVGGVAALGLGGAIFSFALTPDPADVEQTIASLESRKASLQTAR